MTSTFQSISVFKCNINPEILQLVRLYICGQLEKDGQPIDQIQSETHNYELHEKNITQT